MALPTLEWLISDEQVFGQDDEEWSGLGLSMDTSGLQCVNFLKFIESHIDEHSNYFEPVSSAYSGTHGTLVLGLKASANQRLSGINFILGTSTSGTLSMGDELTDGRRGCEPHNEQTSGNNHDIIWMAMTIGMQNPADPAGASGLSAGDWYDLDWADNTEVPYSTSTPRFSGFSALSSTLYFQGDESDAWAFRIIESAEALCFVIRETITSGCFIGGGGAIITPQDSGYAEVPGTGGWNDSLEDSELDPSNNRLFGVFCNGVNYNNRNPKVSDSLWTTGNETNARPGTMFWSGWPDEGNEIGRPVFSIFNPLNQTCARIACNRLTLFHIAQNYAGDLTTIGGTRVHLDVPVQLQENPYYFLGSLRQIRAGQDTVCGTILKDSTGATKSILWSPDAAIATDAIAFDND